MNNKHLRNLARFSCTISCAFIFASCDSSSGFQTGSNSSQDPDPVVVDLPVAYVARPVPRDEDGNIVADEVFDPAAFKPGARLILKDRASVQAAEINLTDDVFSSSSNAPAPLYDVKDLSVSRDGLKLLFSMRAPADEDADEDEQPSWNIWEYDTETAGLRRVISSDTRAEAGHDISPRYLANGDIIFSSTRQPRAKAILLDENKPQFDPGTEDDRDEASFALHVMEPDGTEIEQITFNQSHDLSPEPLSSGEIIFLRWNNYVGGEDVASLYRANIDGSNVGPYYGYHSQNTGTAGSEAVFTKPVQAPDGRILVTLKLRESESQGGDMVLIDGENYIEIDRAINGASPSVLAQESASPGEVSTDDSASSGGYFSSAHALNDGTARLIASWSDCLVLGLEIGTYQHLDGTLVDGNGNSVNEDGNRLGDNASPVVPDPDDIQALPCTRDITVLDQLSAPTPAYGIWTFDPLNNTQRPVVLTEPDMMFTEVVVLEERPQLQATAPSSADDETQALINENLGVIHIHSVYDLNGIDNSPNGIDAMADPLQTPADARPARFLRILKAVSLPNEDVYDFDNSAFGRAGGQMKDIIGYVPIEPDGSAKFALPADIAFTFSVLDASGKRVVGDLGDRHQNWLSVRPGEVRECNGCHEADSSEAHGRFEAEAPSSWTGAAGGVAFANTVLLDNSTPPLPHVPPETGETMAEYYTRVNGLRAPTVNIEFEDEWSDESLLAKAIAFDLSYADMESTSHPVSAACQNTWNGLCRIVINYIEHVQPLWDAERLVLDEVDPSILVEDRTCTSCHSPVDAAGQAQVPAAQLELISDLSIDQIDYLSSYAELFFPDVPQEVVDGVLVDQLTQALDDEGNPLYVTDADGNFILDEDGGMIPILVTVDPDPAFLNSAGARSNANFFNLFAPGGSHEGDLNAAELKLLAEWLDIGGQYYNNPFDAPE